MKCNNCGSNNAEGATFCPECGSRMLATAAPAAQSADAPAQPVQPQPQVPPQQQYAPPYGSPYQQAYRPPVVPTIRTVHLGDVLFLIASVLLLGIGFENFSTITGGAGAQYIVLGLVAILGGLFMMALVIMPELLKSVHEFMDVLVLAFSLVVTFWGLVATFANNVGFLGGILLAAGLFGLAGCGLRMGMIK